MPDGCGGESTRARTCKFRALVGASSTDFSLSDLRFIVAVWSFFGFKARVFAFLINDAPLEFPGLSRLRWDCIIVESKLCRLADKITDCCETETQRMPMPVEVTRNSGTGRIRPLAV
jgi:hypothetical protein